MPSAPIYRRSAYILIGLLLVCLGSVCWHYLAHGTSLREHASEPHPDFWITYYGYKPGQLENADQHKEPLVIDYKHHTQVEEKMVDGIVRGIYASNPHTLHKWLVVGNGGDKTVEGLWAFRFMSFADGLATPLGEGIVNPRALQVVSAHSLERDAGASSILKEILNFTVPATDVDGYDPEDGRSTNDLATIVLEKAFIESGWIVDWEDCTYVWFQKTDVPEALEFWRINPKPWNNPSKSGLITAFELWRGVIDMRTLSVTWDKGKSI